MAHVIKVKYEGTLRRATIPESEVTSVRALSKRVLDLFGLPAEAKLRISYTDSDGDVVGLVDDEDMKDALLLQRLNPLKLVVEEVVVGNPLEEQPPMPAMPARLPPVERFVRNKQVLEIDGEKAEETDEEEPEAIESEEESEFDLVDSGSSATIDEASLPHIAAKVAELKVEAATKKVVDYLTLAHGETDGTVDLQVLLSQAPKLAEMVLDLEKYGIHASFEPSMSGDSVAASEPVEGSSSAVSVASSSAGFVAAKACVEASQPVQLTAAEASSQASEQISQETEKVRHLHVECDVCGVHPIVGPRFKSIVKHNYDLCGACYAKHGVDGDYEKIERPLYRPRPQSISGWKPATGAALDSATEAVMSVTPSVAAAPAIDVTSGSSAASSVVADDSMMDARFVKDVTVCDGEEFAPNERFIKIWRLKNSGSAAWPVGTRLMCVGGDRMHREDLVVVEVPEGGVLPEGEVEVAVELVAPAEPGRYISHWRLMAPGARKFGHRVWALIQVKAPQKGSPSPPTFEDSTPSSVDSTPSSVSSSQAALASVTERLAPTPAADAVNKESTPAVVAEVVSSPPAISTSSAAISASRSASDSPRVENTSVGRFSLVEHPVQGEASLGSQVAAPALPATPWNAPVSAAPVGGAPVMVQSPEAEFEELLKQLESMGFADRVLNTDLLKETSMDLQKTLDGLVAVGEWDPMVAELAEMGFADASLNRRLLLKNKGSVRGVVKELVQQYKDAKKNSTKA